MVIRRASGLEYFVDRIDGVNDSIAFLRSLQTSFGIKSRHLDQFQTLETRESVLQISVFLGCYSITFDGTEMVRIVTV